MRSIVGAVLVMLVLAAPAGARPPANYFTEVTYPDGSWATQEDAWIDAGSLPSVDARIVIDWARCPFGERATVYTLSCAAWHRRHWRIWLDPLTAEEAQRMIFYHELFHIRDAVAGPDLNRIRRSLRRINGWRGDWAASPWPSTIGPEMPAGPSERAADAAAWCAVTPRSQWAAFDVTRIGRLPDYGWRPTKAQFVASCTALRRER